MNDIYAKWCIEVWFMCCHCLRGHNLISTISIHYKIHFGKWSSIFSFFLGVCARAVRCRPISLPFHSPKCSKIRKKNPVKGQMNGKNQPNTQYQLAFTWWLIATWDLDLRHLRAYAGIASNLSTNHLVGWIHVSVAIYFGFCSRRRRRRRHPLLQLDSICGEYSKMEWKARNLSFASLRLGAGLKLTSIKIFQIKFISWKMFSVSVSARYTYRQVETIVCGPAQCTHSQLAHT